jgi:hypothetical protein
LINEESNDIRKSKGFNSVLNPQNQRANTMAPQYMTSPKFQKEESKDMLEKLEEIEEEGFADGVDMLEPSDVKSFHENLVKTLDYLVNQTLSILTRGSPVANTAARNTMANKNRIS